MPVSTRIMTRTMSRRSGRGFRDGDAVVLDRVPSRSPAKLPARRERLVHPRAEEHGRRWSSTPVVGCLQEASARGGGGQASRLARIPRAASSTSRFARGRLRQSRSREAKGDRSNPLVARRAPFTPKSDCGPVVAEGRPPRGCDAARRPGPQWLPKRTRTRRTPPKLELMMRSRAMPRRVPRPPERSPDRLAHRPFAEGAVESMPSAARSTKLSAPSPTIRTKPPSTARRVASPPQDSPVLPSRRRSRQARSPKTSLPSRSVREPQLSVGVRVRARSTPHARTARHDGSPPIKAYPLRTINTR